MADRCIYTIGHSTQPAERFIELLRRHGIEAVADVRSTPYSRLNPQFNREHIKSLLKEAGIAYVFLGDELGARSKDPAACRNGRIDYELLARTPIFRAGLERVRKGGQSHRIALMCAEKDPLECHRTILVSRHLVEQGVPVVHILSDGQLEPHEQAMSRLLRLLHIDENDLFRPREDALREAYRERGEAIAYEAEGEPARLAAKAN